MARAAGDLIAEAEAEADDALQLRQSWNVAPTSDVPIVLERLIDGTATRQVHVARWGLVPSWAKDISVGVRAFNARSETAAEKPTFKSSVKSRRCAVPVEGYYEWRKEPDGSKTPFFVHRKDGRLTFFAGLYSWWKDPTKENSDPERWLLSTSVITMASPEPGTPEILDELANLHDRLPIPMSTETMNAWLHPGNSDGATLLGLVRSGAYNTASAWRLDKVGPEVGNVRNDSQNLITPVT